MIIPVLVIWRVIPEYYPEHPVSILFTRSAGEQAPVSAQLALLPEDVGNKTAEIILNGQSIGAIQNISEEGIAKLSEKQTTELLTALKGNASIEVVFGEFNGESI